MPTDEDQNLDDVGLDTTDNADLDVADIGAGGFDDNPMPMGPMGDTDKKPVFNDLLSDDAEKLKGKHIKSVPRPKVSTEFDVTQKVVHDIATAGLNGQLDVSELESFFTLSSDRNQLYQLLDTMAEDPIIAAALEIYTEDTCAANDEGQSIWCTSDDIAIKDYVEYLLRSLQVDKKIYGWTYSFIKYGDLYLRLYHESDMEEDPLFSDEEPDKKKKLDEDIKLVAHKNTDKYATYVEAAINPAEVYELTKFGKTYAYVKADAPVDNTTSFYETGNAALRSANKFKRKDLHIYPATDYVHAIMGEANSRYDEKLYLYMNDADYEADENAYAYKVRRGRALLADAFKIWREITLLENSMILNRLTKSSVLRIFQVEVGDMPKEQVNPHLAGIKQLVEQKSAFSVGESMQEYVNPGPVENNVYIPQRNGMGAITLQNVGGDVDVKGLSDIDYFQNKLYAILRIPKQYLGDTDDSTGFNGGTSLSLVSSRYARTVNRIQNALVDAITTMVNIFLISRGQDKYIGKFELHMKKPSTQEDLDYMSTIETQIQMRGDILDMLSDIQDPAVRLTIAKALLSSIDFIDTEVMDAIDDGIEKEKKNAAAQEAEDFGTPFGGGGSGGGFGGGAGGLGDVDLSPEDIGGEDLGTEEAPAEEPSGGGENDLPSPSELGVDFASM